MGNSLPGSGAFRPRSSFSPLGPCFSAAQVAIEAALAPCSSNFPEAHPRLLRHRRGSVILLKEGANPLKRLLVERAGVGWYVPLGMLASMLRTPKKLKIVYAVVAGVAVDVMDVETERGEAFICAVYKAVGSGDQMGAEKPDSHMLVFPSLRHLHCGSLLKAAPFDSEGGRASVHVHLSPEYNPAIGDYGEYPEHRVAVDDLTTVLDGTELYDAVEHGEGDVLPVGNAVLFSSCGPADHGMGIVRQEVEDALRRVDVFGDKEPDGDGPFAGEAPKDAGRVRRAPCCCGVFIANDIGAGDHLSAMAGILSHYGSPF